MQDEKEGNELLTCHSDCRGSFAARGQPESTIQPVSPPLNVSPYHPINPTKNLLLPLLWLPDGGEASLPLDLPLQSSKTS